MKKAMILTCSSLCAALMLSLWSAVPLFGTDARTPASTMFKVTVTNLTRGQPFSPVVIATHTPKMEPVFEPGEPASDTLYPLAEDGMTDPLLTKLGSDPEVWEVTNLFGANGPILPGESATVMIEAENGFPLISMASMLVDTNDGFFGLHGDLLPKARKKTFYVPAYDAGSETNNENGRFIPGPPFGNVGVRDTSKAEGFVHVHSGVVGKLDLDPAMHDWRNPVARVVIEPM